MNPTTKTPSRFANYQEQKQRRRENYIEAYLVVARSSRQKYDYVTDLAKAISHHIALSEKREGISNTECNPSTLLRNKRYKAMLLSYMAENVGKGLKNLCRTRVTVSPTDQSNSLLAGIESSNLRNENQRLKYYIAELESSRERKGAGTAPESEVLTGPTGRNEFAEMEFKFVSTCQVVSAILTKLQDVLVADIEKKWILDAAIRRGDNVIVDEKLAAPFFEWLKKHASGM